MKISKGEKIALSIIIGVPLILMFVYFMILGSVKGCNLEKVTILSWGASNDSFLDIGVNPKKTLVYSVDDDFRSMKFNDSMSVDDIKNIFPEGEDYILTWCNEELGGIVPDNIMNDYAYFKMAKVLNIAE